MEYKVHWENENLGLTLRPDLGDNEPPVVIRIRSKSEMLRKVKLGHMLVKINEISTRGTAYSENVARLQSVERPCVLTFEVPQSVEREKIVQVQKSEIYKIYWTHGPLGMILRPDDEDCHIPCIRRFTGKGDCEGLQLANLGDRLIQINDIVTRKRGFRYTVALLKEIQKPATLFFKKMHRRKSRSSGSMGKPSMAGIVRDGSMDQSSANSMDIASYGEKGLRNASEKNIRNTANEKAIRNASEKDMRNTAIEKDLLLHSVDKTIRADRNLQKWNKMDSKECTMAGLKKGGQDNGYAVYDVIWRQGELGIKLRPSKQDVPMVSRLTGKGNASGIHNASPMDVLVSVNGDNIEHQSYKETLKRIKKMQKPVVLRFRPSKQIRDSLRSIQSAQDSRNSVSSDSNRRYSANNSVDKQVCPLDMNAKTTAHTSDVEIVTSQTGSSHKQGGTSLHHGKSSYSQVEKVHSTSDNKRAAEDPKQTNIINTNAKYEQDAVEETEDEKDEDSNIMIGANMDLDAAKQLTAKAQGLNMYEDSFAGKKMVDIEEGTREAQLLRLQARRYVIQMAEDEKQNLKNDEKLSRAERERIVLEESLRQVQEQAKAYDEYLAKQERAKILLPVTQGRSSVLVGRQNRLLEELADVIVDYKRDSYSDEGEEDAIRQSLRLDLQQVLEIQSQVSSMDAKVCHECGLSEEDAHLEMDTDGEFYCVSCWEQFWNRASPNSKLASKERDACLEAKAKLQEIESMRLSKDSFDSDHTSNKSKGKKEKSQLVERERIGKQELFQALQEQELKAREEGNTDLAIAYAVEAARTSGNTSFGSDDFRTSKETTSSHMTFTRRTSDFDKDSNQLSRRLSRGSSNVSDAATAPPSSITPEQYFRIESQKRDQERIEALNRRRASLDTVKLNKENASTPVDANDTVQDTSSNLPTTLKKQSSAQKINPSDSELELQLAKEKNYALAKQIDEAHGVVERTRLSMSFIGSSDVDSGADNVPSPVGLSEDQVSLFKKLTVQGEERMSFLEQFDSSGSDSGGESEFELADQSASSDQGSDGVWI